jgi:negative regulator of flagellin synthesis FlgM
MYIDGKVQFPSDAQAEAVKTSKNVGGSATGAANKQAGVSPASGEDTFSLSSKHGQVQVLAASLAAVPEVRTERVNSLREQLNQGQYRPASGKVADAILQEHGKVSVSPQ